LKIILTEREEISDPDIGLLVCELEIASWLAEDITKDEKLSLLMKLIPAIHNKCGLDPRFRAYSPLEETDAVL